MAPQNEPSTSSVPLFNASSLWIIMGCVTLVSAGHVHASAAGETKIITIPAKPGKDVILPCKAPENKPVEVLECERTDSGEPKVVFSYQDDKHNYHPQHPDYKNRVDSQDREMKDGNVSLVSKNPTVTDAGTYKWKVAQNRTKRSYLDSDPICIINSNVSSQGNKNEQQGNEDNLGSKVGVPVAAIGLIALVVFSFHKKCRRDQNQPPVVEPEQQRMNDEDEAESGL